MARSTSIIVFTCAALLAGAYAHAAGGVPIAKGLALKSARAELLKQGWKPRGIQRVAPSAAMDAFHNAGYTETEQCSGNEYFCVLDYVNPHGACLRVTVEYATIAPLKAWVASWTSECPNPELLAKPAG